MRRKLRCLAFGGIAAIMACGDDLASHESSDASPDSDASAPSTNVTVVISGDTGAAFVDVYFHNADGSLIVKVTTDESGQAAATVTPNAFLTVVNPFGPPGDGGPDDVRTIAGVQPGDELPITKAWSVGFGPNRVDVVADADPNASQYSLWSNCAPFEPGTPTVEMSVDSGASSRPHARFYSFCTAPSVLVESKNSSGASVGWLFLDTVPFQGQSYGSAYLEGPYAPTTQVNAMFDGIPDNVSQLSGISFISAPYRLWGQRSELSLVSGTSSWSFSRPEPANSTQTWDMRMYSSVAHAEHRVLEMRPIAEPPVFSYADSLLSFTEDPSFDAATHSVTWTEASTGVVPDVAIAEVRASRDDTTSLTWKWRLAGVPDGASLVYPVLPADIAQYNPLASDSLSVADVSTAKVSIGYDASLRSMVQQSDDLGDALHSVLSHTGGRIVVQRYSSP